MFKYIVIFVLVLLHFAVSIAGVATKSSNNTIVLEKKNTVLFRNVFTSSSVSQLQERLYEVSNKLQPSEVIYLFLDTPGGDVDAGNELISFIKNLPQEVKTITNRAASMGFHTVQALGERLILPNGVLMSHRATIGLYGQIPGEFDTRLEYIKNMINDVEAVSIKRLQISHEEYSKKIFQEYWIVGQKAIKEKAADRVVNVRCSPDMPESINDRIDTIFGSVRVVWYGCPLISAPKSFSFDNFDGGTISQVESAKKTIIDVMSDLSLLTTNKALKESFSRLVRLKTWI